MIEVLAIGGAAWLAFVACVLALCRIARLSDDNERGPFV